MTRRALITGITGQDGSYLAERLLEQGYEVHGLVRRVALEDPELRLARLAAVRDRVHLHAGSMENFASIFNAVQQIQPSELYHLAAQSFVSYSFEDAFSTFRVNIDGTHFALESVRQAAPACRVYFAGSSEMFGNAAESPQNEQTRFAPRSPYGISKVTGYELARNYREAYGLFVANGILFNHESPRRGLEFVTRKVTSHVAGIKLGLSDRLRLGNLEASRDWGHAIDYVAAIQQMLAHDTPDDFVIATGRSHTVAQLCELAFNVVGLDWRKYVEPAEEYFRPAEVHALVGDSSKARRVLGWEPQRSFEQLIEEMVLNDLALLAR